MGYIRVFDMSCRQVFDRFLTRMHTQVWYPATLEFWELVPTAAMTIDFFGVWIRTKSKQSKSTWSTYWEITPLAIRLGILGTVMVCLACGSQNQTADVAKQHCDVSFEITPCFECVKQICWCQKNKNTRSNHRNPKHHGRMTGPLLSLCPDFEPHPCKQSAQMPRCNHSSFFHRGTNNHWRCPCIKNQGKWQRSNSMRFCTWIHDCKRKNECKGKRRTHLKLGGGCEN